MTQKITTVEEVKQMHNKEIIKLIKKEKKFSEAFFIVLLNMLDAKFKDEHILQTWHTNDKTDSPLNAFFKEN